jgi:Zn-dependent peptidase ImmA (M78 family)
MNINSEIRKSLEDYINKRIKGLKVPINVQGDILNRFGILRIVQRGKGRSAFIQPCKGGFTIFSRVSPTKINYRFLIAHEIAHTFFYDFRGPDEYPIHYPEPFEEELCDFGARAILIPKFIISPNLIKNPSLKKIIELSSVLEIEPQWLMLRLIENANLFNSAFLIFQAFEESLELKKKVNSPSLTLNRKIIGDVRKIIKEYSNEKYKTANKVYLGYTKQGGYFDMEIFRQDVDFFTKKHYAMLKPSP